MDFELKKKLRSLQITVARKIDSVLMGEYSSAFRGSGIEFDEVREYAYGDDIRAIDWNVSARQSKTFIKKYREEKELNVCVLIDYSSSQNFGKAESCKLNRSIEVAATLLYCAMLNNDSFRVIGFDENVVFANKSAKGKAHLFASFIKMLSLDKLNAKTNIKQVIDYFSLLHTKKSLVFIISDFIDKDYELALAKLSQTHELINIRVFHPSEMQVKVKGLVPGLGSESNTSFWMPNFSLSSKNSNAIHFDSISSTLRHLKRSYHIDYLNLNVENDFYLSLKLFFQRHKKNNV